MNSGFLGSLRRLCDRRLDPETSALRDITTGTRRAGTRPWSPGSPRAVSGHSLEALSKPRGAQFHFKTMRRAKALLLCRPPGRCRRSGPCVSCGERGEGSRRAGASAGLEGRGGGTGPALLTEELARCPLCRSNSEREKSDVDAEPGALAAWLRTRTSGRYTQSSTGSSQPHGGPGRCPGLLETPGLGTTGRRPAGPAAHHRELHTELQPPHRKGLRQYRKTALNRSYVTSALRVPCGPLNVHFKNSAWEKGRAVLTAIQA